MAEGIKVGDAVLKFHADTSALDAGFAKVDAQMEKTKQGFTGFDQVVERSKTGFVGFDGVLEQEFSPALKEMEVNSREAKGEIGLLGEAIGIRLPRHVRSFVAELPGMGEALTAAFSATAVLFVVEAIVQATEKLTDFVASTFIYTDAMKEEENQVKEVNKKLVEQNEELKKLQRELEELGLSSWGKFNLAMKETGKNLDDQRKKLADIVKEQHDFVTSGKEWADQFLANQSVWSKGLDFVKGYFGMETSFMEASKKKGQELADARKEQINETKIAEEQHEIARQKLLNEEADEEAKLYERGKRIQEETNRLIEKNLKAWSDLEKKFIDVSQAQAEVINPQIKLLQQWGQAMQDLGIKSVAIMAYELGVEKQAVDKVEQAYQHHIGTLQDVQRAKLKLVQDEIAYQKAVGGDTTALERQETQLKRSLKIDQEKDKSLVRMTHLEQVFAQQVKNGATVQQAASRTIAEAVGSAVAAYTMGQASIGQALAAMVQQELASVAQRSAIKAIEQLALGFSTMFTNPAESGSHFTSAALFGAIAGGAMAAGHAMGGATGTRNTQLGGPGNPINTGTQLTTSGAGAVQTGPVGTTNVQHFAAGGLITGPTMALLGERIGSKGEVAFDLSDERAKSSIREAMGGGMSSINVHVKGLISPDNLNKVVKKINRQVKGRQVQLLASNSHRITRRSS